MRFGRAGAVRLLTFLMWIAPLSAQGEMRVTGRVLYNPLMPDCLQPKPCLEDIRLTRDEDWRPPTAAVNVLVKGTDRVAKTNREGYYEIAVPGPDASLMFLYLGHNRIEVPVSGRTVINVQLTPTPLPVIDRLLGVLLPEIHDGRFPDIDQAAAKAEVNRETARDFLWLLLGNRRMIRQYPDERIPDYRFDD